MFGEPDGSRSVCREQVSCEDVLSACLPQSLVNMCFARACSVATDAGGQVSCKDVLSDDPQLLVDNEGRV